MALILAEEFLCVITRVRVREKGRCFNNLFSTMD